MSDPAALPGPLVDTSWLAAQLGEPDLIVLDATYFMPHEGRDARAEFRQARIPGARFFDIDAIADDATDLPHMVPSAGRFEQLAGALGIGNESRLVFYDQRGIFSAPRGWWLMGLFGHDGAAVLDGGLPKWRAEQRPVETGEPPPPAPSRFRASFRAARLRGLGDMLANLRGGAELVLDARSAPRFRGEAPEPRPGLRGGHIPGAVNLPWGEVLAADGTMLPQEALRARLAAAGADGTRPVVTSCGSGVSAAILTLALARAGLPQGALYDGSWSEWGAREDLPIAR